MQFPLRKLAAIDIGSNAVRCQISAVLYYEGRYRLKRVEYVRFPMRLGEDVFATGQISPAKEEQFIKFLHSLKLLMEVHGVVHYLVCATSAMRSAANGQEIVARVREQLGMEIKVIDGQAEAFYINRVIEHVLEDNKHYLHIDVGGGSTEFNIYHDRRKVAAQSFEIGSIRRMQEEESGLNTQAQAELWIRMEEWVHTNARAYHVTRAIGTGGNINKLYSLTSAAPNKPVTRRIIQTTLARLASLSLNDRVTGVRVSLGGSLTLLKQ
jgi:exopolyphosphatase/guanosine-5'-triphosphate,3'-diphosphate pyrophosphatase